MTISTQTVTDMPDLTVNLAGIAMGSPVTLLSGCVGFGDEMIHLAGYDQEAVGAIFLKGTTLEARRGNPTPRLAETAAGMLNAIGLQNPGARTVAHLYLPRLKGMITSRLIANIAGKTVEEYGEVARIFDNSPVDGIEINISCPNVQQGGVAFGVDPRVAAQVVTMVRKATSKPIITKLSPNVTDIKIIARAALEAGTDAFSAINTLMGMAVDIHQRRPVLGNVQGGLSGPAIKPVALLKVWQVYQVAAPYNIPIVGQGGIASAEDALEFFIAGASAVGLGTVLFRDPLIASVILAGIRDYLVRYGMTSLRDLTGLLDVRPPIAHGA